MAAVPIDERDEHPTITPASKTRKEQPVDRRRFRHESRFEIDHSPRLRSFICDTMPRSNHLALRVVCRVVAKAETILAVFKSTIIPLDSCGFNNTAGVALPQTLNNGFVFAVEHFDSTYHADWGSVLTTFYVPDSPPAGGSGVQFFMWQGIESVHDLYQPLIFYNNSSSYSFQASKYQNGSGYFGTPYSVGLGDILRTTTGRSNYGVHSEYLYKWNGSSWTYLGGGGWADTDSYFPTAIYGAVETYFMTSCSQYPGAVFYGIYSYIEVEAFDQLQSCEGMGCTPTTPSAYELASCPTDSSCTTSCTQNSSTQWDWSWSTSKVL
jgi:hypothetical protein